MSSELPCPAQANVPAALLDVLRRLQRGDLPANVALMHLIMRADTPEQVSEAVRAGIAMSAATPAARSRMNALAKIWSQTPHAWSTVKDIVSVAVPGRFESALADPSPSPAGPFFIRIDFAKMKDAWVEPGRARA
jgi:hypothetical protein